MKTYRLYGHLSGSVDLGEFEAESLEEAIELAWESDKCAPTLCWQCSDEVEIGEVYEVIEG